MNTVYPAPDNWQNAAPAYQQPYWQAKPVYGSSTLVNIAGVVLLILGALFTVGGLLFVLVAMAGSAFIGSIDPTWEELGSAAAVVVAVMAFIILAIGITELVTSIGLFVHKSWARWTGVVISVIGILLGLFMVMAAYEPPADGGLAAFALVWTAAHAFTAAALAAGGEHFERAQPMLR